MKYSLGFAIAISSMAACGRVDAPRDTIDGNLREDPVEDSAIPDIIVDGDSSDPHDTRVQDTLDAFDVQSQDMRDSADVSEEEPISEAMPPILSRRSLDTYRCEVERNVTKVAPEFANYFDRVSSVANGAVATLSLDGKMYLARLNQDGTTSDATDLQRTGSTQTSIATAEGVIAVVTGSDGDSGMFEFRRFDEIGLRPDGPPTFIPVDGANSVAPFLVARNQGWTLAYALNTATNDRGIALAFISTTGMLDEPPVTIATDARLGGLLALTTGGYAAAWTVETVTSSEVFFVELDSHGEVILGPKRISKSSKAGFWSSAGFRPANIIAQSAAKIYVAFTEESRIPDAAEYSGTSGNVQIAVIESDTVKLHPLQSRVLEKTVGWPTLYPVGDRVGILWSFGSVIYECGGCITDFDLHFVLVDIASLAPVAEPCIQMQQGNGFRLPQGAMSEGRLLTVLSLDYHALSYPATGVFTLSER